MLARLFVCGVRVYAYTHAKLTRIHIYTYIIFVLGCYCHGQGCFCLFTDFMVEANNSNVNSM